MIPRALSVVATLVAVSGSFRSQSPAAQFDAATVALGPRAQFAALLDVDGDGDRDAVDVYPRIDSGYDVRVLRNDGTGVFVESFAHFVAGTAAQTFTALPVASRTDLNGDGFDDFVVMRNGNVQYFLADGLGGATFVGAVMASTSASLLAAGDADGDGDDDVFVAGLDNGLFGQVIGAQMLRNDGGIVAATLGVPTAVVAPVAGILPTPIGAVAGEFTGDSGADFAVGFNGIASDTVVAVYRYDGAALTLHQLHGLGGVVNAALVAGDIDGDSDLDLLVVGSPAGAFYVPTYQVIRRLSGATLAAENVAYGAGGFTTLADVDQDGDLDGVGHQPRANWGSNGASDYASSEFLVAVNVGGVLTSTWRLPAAGRTTFAAAADLDGDGDVDLVGGRSVYVGLGALVAPSIVSPTFNPFPIPNFNAFASTRHPTSFVDYDSDGDPDFDFGYSATIQSTRRNDGTGVVSAALPQFPAPPAGRNFAGPGVVGDFDGDGDQDLIVEELTASAYFATRLLRNTGGGHFASAVACIPGGDRMFPNAGGVNPTTEASAGIVADFDGDGDLDVAARWNFDGGGTRVWINSGTGFFTLATFLPNEFPLGAADLNGDGAADLFLVATSSTLANGTPAIRLATGAGTFGAPVAVPTVVFGALRRDLSPAVADFDDDGDLDWAAWLETGVATTTGYAAELRIFWNDGAGAFPTSTVRAAGPDAGMRVFAVDVDEDGEPDLLHSSFLPVLSPDTPTYFQNENHLRYGVVVRREIGPGTFAAPVEQVLAADAFMDVDGDGDADAVGRFAFRNRRFEGPAAGSRRQYGVGYPGTGGVVPVVGDLGPFRTGSSGVLRLRGGRGGAAGLLILGGAPLDLPTPFGGDLYASIDLTLEIVASGPANAAGRGSFDIPWTLPPGFEGFALYHQFALADPGAAFGVSATGGLVVVFGT